MRLYKWLGEASGQTTLNPLDQRWAQTLSRSSVTAGVAVFPIGIGDQYDAAQLRVLAGPGASSNVAELQRIEDLPSMVALAMDCSLPGSSVHGIFRATVLEWFAIA